MRNSQFIQLITEEDRRADIYSTVVDELSRIPQEFSKVWQIKVMLSCLQKTKSHRDFATH